VIGEDDVNEVISLTGSVSHGNQYTQTDRRTDRRTRRRTRAMPARTQSPCNYTPPVVI